MLDILVECVLLNVYFDLRVDDFESTVMINKLLMVAINDWLTFCVEWHKVWILLKYMHGNYYQKSSWQRNRNGSHGIIWAFKIR